MIVTSHLQISDRVDDGNPRLLNNENDFLYLEIAFPKDEDVINIGKLSYANNEIISMICSVEISAFAQYYDSL